MESVWYYVRNGAQSGPVSFDELKSAAASGQLAPADLVWKEGTADWVPSRTVAGLFAGPPPAPLRLPGGREPEPLPLDNSPRGGPSPAGEVFALAKVFLSRTMAANPTNITPTPAEEDCLTRAGILDPTARRYAIWRRAVLWVAVVPTAFAGLFELINAIGTNTDAFNGLGALLVYLEALALAAIPVTAALAANAYDRPAASAKWLLIGALVAVGFPIFMTFIPVMALLDTKAATAEEVAMMRPVVGLSVGIAFYIMLMPMVLSLLPAVSRACMRVKMFLPQSLVPGWGLVASVPLCVLLTLATVVLLYQFVGNILLILGLALWIGSPLLYLTKFSLLTRPVANSRELDSLAKTQFTVLMMVIGGVVLLIMYLFTAKLGKATIMGFDKYDSLIQPWDLRLHKWWIEFVGRSLFMTVLFADLLVRISLSVWREERAFAGTPGAADFDKSMSGMSEAVEGKKG